MLSSDAIAQNLSTVRGVIARQGVDPARVLVVAASKGRSADECGAALAAGITVLGENRVQEAISKMGFVEGARWHLIGHLQTNKVGALKDRFEMIQSVDSIRVAEALAAYGGAPPPVLLEVNAGSEPNKTGLAPADAEAAGRRIAELLDLRGLMTVAPQGPAAAAAFQVLAGLRASLQQRLGIALPELSMGMSDDYGWAVAAGATMIRLGHALFGPAAAPNPAKPLPSRAQ